MKKSTIIKVLQTALEGKLKEDVNLNFIADAIISKTEFEESYKERNTRTVNEAILKFTNIVTDINDDMIIEEKQLGKDETLLKNFVYGQKTACEKIIGEIEKL